MSATRKTKPDTDGPNVADFYETPAWAILAILPRVVSDVETLTPKRWRIFDPCAGEGAILRAIRDKHPRASRCRCDIDGQVREIDVTGLEIRPDAAARCRDLGIFVAPGDFLADRSLLHETGAIVMNPPYGGRTNLAERFVKHALDRLPDNGTVWALLRTNWLLDGQATTGRADWLRDGNTPDVFGLPRRPSFSGDGRADATTYAWMRWVVGRRQKRGAFEVLELPTEQPVTVPPSVDDDPLPW